MHSIARWDFFTVQQFDICCFRSVMRGLLQLSFELRRSFCINICCFIIRINDSRDTILQKPHTSDTPHFCAAPWPSFQKTGHVTARDHWSRDHPIGDPWFAISRFWNFSYTSIGDRDMPHSRAAPWPSFQKAGHVTTRDHWSRDHPIGDPWFPMSRFWNFTDISIGHQVIASKLVVRIFCMGISSKKRSVTLWYTIDKNRCDIWVFQIYEPIGSRSQNFDISTFKGVYP